MAMFVSRELVREKLAVCLFEESVAFVRINMYAIHKKRMLATHKNTHVSVSIRIHIYEYTHKHTHTHTNTHKHICTYAYRYMHIHAYTGLKNFNTIKHKKT
jgi:hypothetical protein